MNQHEMLWKDVSERIKNSGKIINVQYNTWIASIEKAQFGTKTLFLWAPNSIAKNSVEERYIDLIKDSVFKITKKNYNIKVLLRGETAPFEEPEETEKPNINQIIKEDGVHLNPKFTFDNFIVGNSNRFAHAYALSVAEAPGGKFNPLFIYGGAGLGKTHLCHAIGNFIKQSRPDAKILFVSSEKYTNDFIHSLRDKTTDMFRELYRNADILIVDDIQFIAGKESTIEEFFHTFNELYENDKQIVLASDRPPNEIDIEDRVKSRFEMGLLCDITPPDFETRIAILKDKSKSLGYMFSDDVYNFIADNIKSNIRQLEGAPLKIVAYKSLNPEELDENTVIQVLKDFVISKENVNVTFSMIQKAVSKYFHITVDEIMGSGKRKEVALARQICFYMCEKYVKGATASSIGREFSRDHSTVIYGINKIADDLKKKEEIKTIIEDIKKNLD